MKTILLPYYDIPSVDAELFLEHPNCDIQMGFRNWARMLRDTADQLLDVARVVKGKSVTFEIDNNDHFEVVIKGLDEPTEAELSKIGIIDIEGLEKHQCPDCGGPTDYVFDDEE